MRVSKTTISNIKKTPLYCGISRSNKELYSVKELAELFNKSQLTVRCKIRNGEIKTINISTTDKGRVIRVHKNEILEFMTTPGGLKWAI